MLFSIFFQEFDCEVFLRKTEKAKTTIKHGQWVVRIINATNWDQFYHHLYCSIYNSTSAAFKNDHKLGLQEGIKIDNLPIFMKRTGDRRRIEQILVTREIFSATSLFIGDLVRMEQLFLWHQFHFTLLFPKINLSYLLLNKQNSCHQSNTVLQFKE